MVPIRCLSLVLALATSCCAFAQTSHESSDAMPFRGIIPQPRSLEIVPHGRYVLRSHYEIAFDKPFAAVAQYAATALAPATGFSLKPVPRAEAKIPGPGITFALRNGLPTEAYTLTMTENNATITASSPAGALCGFQTFRQLFDARLCGTQRVPMTWIAPLVTVEDLPKFGWRALHLDEARHFFGKAAVKQVLDAMALFKLNILHWHLTDNQGWRIEILKYPDLTRKAALRSQSPVPFGPRKPWTGDGQPYGPFFYTQSDIREIVAYAAARGIQIVPEIEIPGHSAAALHAYPQYSCTGSVAEQWMWGRSQELYCAGRDETLAFLKDILDEVCALFPAPYVHLGGDETPKARWNACPRCQARIKTLGLADTAALQTWLLQELGAHLATKGRRYIAWDEILESPLASDRPQPIVMAWRGQWQRVKGGAYAANHRLSTIFTSERDLYLDFPTGEPGDPHEYVNTAPTTIDRVYTFDPRKGIAPGNQHYIMGVQACNWSEYTATPEVLAWKMWPRACALAELGWRCDPDAKHLPDFKNRLPAAVARLQAMGLQPSHPITPRP